MISIFKLLQLIGINRLWDYINCLTLFSLWLACMNTFNALASCVGEMLSASCRDDEVLIYRR